MFTELESPATTVAIVEVKLKSAYHYHLCHGQCEEYIKTTLNGPLELTSLSLGRGARHYFLAGDVAEKRSLRARIPREQGKVGSAGR